MTNHLLERTAMRERYELSLRPLRAYVIGRIDQQHQPIENRIAECKRIGEPIEICERDEFDFCIEAIRKFPPGANAYARMQPLNGLWNRMLGEKHFTVQYFSVATNR